MCLSMLLSEQTRGCCARAAVRTKQCFVFELPWFLSQIMNVDHECFILTFISLEQMGFLVKYLLS